MKDLERYIELIVASQMTQEAFDHFCAAMRERGYDRIAYSLVNDHPSLGLLQPAWPGNQLSGRLDETLCGAQLFVDRSGDAAGVDEAYAVLLVRHNVQA